MPPTAGDLHGMWDYVGKKSERILNTWMSHFELIRMENTTMHDLLIGLAFLAILFCPAVVASYSGKSESSPE